MQSNGGILFRKFRPGFLLAACAVFCAPAGRAMIYSTNSGMVPNTGIHYTATLETDANERLAIRIHLKNNSDKPYYIARSAFDVPGNLAVFFSTDDTPLVSSTGEWASSISSCGSVTGCLDLLPGKTADEIFPVGFYYDKIYKKRHQSNIYVYWGITMRSASDDPEVAARENRPLRPITNEVLPRIGGMLSLPKKPASKAGE